MEIIAKKAREIASRLAVIKFLEVFFFSMAVVGGVFVLLILIEKFFFVNLYAIHVLPVLVIAAAVVAFVTYVPVRSSVRTAAVKADEELKLKERLSTALTSAGGPSPFTPLMLADAKRHAEGIRVGQSFPVRVRLRTWLVPAVLVLAGFLLTLLNPIDVFGRGKTIEKRKEEKKKTTKIVKTAVKRIENITKEEKFRQADKDVKDVFEGVLKDVKNLVKNPKNFKDAMKEIEEKEERVAREARKYAKIGDDLADEMNKELNELRDLIRDIPKHMKKSEFDKLLKKLKEMEKKVEKSTKLSDKEKKALKQQMRDMASLTRKMKNKGPDVVLPAEFRSLMKQMKSTYASLPRELSKAEKERLKKLLSNKEFLKKLKKQLQNAQNQLAKGGG
ncbi:MAG: hypothetical protein ACYS8W_16415 [Planctomycetota bacterium]|jgi:hypothetical protein